mmetsp:Transcript_11983/g.22890  ORF Transcript_11983/g.22890 Transcript_11983/m.22890 type:complete len:95 (+) Transcript_11983:862-1146(+)
MPIAGWRRVRIFLVRSQLALTHPGEAVIAEEKLTAHNLPAAAGAGAAVGAAVDEELTAILAAVAFVVVVAAAVAGFDCAECGILTKLLGREGIC